MSNKDKIFASRYPGAAPFRREQQRIFFGRTKDIDNIKKLINENNQLLLYSDSGVGKSSLLNAGLIPDLSNTYNVLNIRFTLYDRQTGFTQDEHTDNNETVYKNKLVKTIIETLLSDFSYEVNKTKEGKQTPENLDIILENIDTFTRNKILNSLWYNFKRVQLSGNEKPFLLVFDQFEELFTYPKEEIAEFKEKLYELLHVKIPGYIVEEIEAYNKSNKSKGISLSDLKASINTKIIFSIKRESYGLLNKLSDKFPTLKDKYYELQPLTYSQVVEAIEEPGKVDKKIIREVFAEIKKNDNITFSLEDIEVCPKFSFEQNNENGNIIVKEIIGKLRARYDEETLDEIIKKNAFFDIEATQLQIVCQDIEKRIYENKIQEFTKANLESIEFKDIFTRFINDTINELPEEKKEKIEDIWNLLIAKFISENGQRLSYDDSLISDKEIRDCLQILVSKHLIQIITKSDNRIAYELSHDTLVAPLLETKTERIRREKIAKYKSKINRLKYWILGLTISLIASIVCAIFVLIFWDQAKTAEENTNREKTKTDSIKIERERTLLEKSYVEANYIIATTNNCDSAINHYKNAFSFAPTYRDQLLMKERIDTLEKTRKELDNNKNLITKISDLMMDQKYSEAVNVFESVNKQIKNKEVLKILKQSLKIQIENAREVFNDRAKKMKEMELWDSYDINMDKVNKLNELLGKLEKI